MTENKIVWDYQTSVIAQITTYLDEKREYKLAKKFKKDPEKKMADNLKKI